MTDDEKRAEIAEAHLKAIGYQAYYHFRCMLGYDEKEADYLNDLNAMHEAVKTLNTGQAIAFIKELSIILGKDQNAVSVWELHHTESYNKLLHGMFIFTTATARQRAEAFGRTMGLWNESGSTIVNENAPSLQRELFNPPLNGL